MADAGTTKSTIPFLSHETAKRSTTPFFGRAYRLTITPTRGPNPNVPIVVTSDEWEPNALRITFDVYQYAYSAYWQASITIWNADGQITDGPSKGMDLYQALLLEGDLVELCAGYQADYPDPAQLPVIWSGPIFYTIQDRLDAVDKRLKIICLINRALTVENFLNDTLPARAAQFQQARFIADHSKNKINIDEGQIMRVLDSVPSNKAAEQLPRGKSYFGNPHPYLSSIAEQNNLLNWFDGRSWKLDSFSKPGGSPLGGVVATYAPRVLLDDPPTSENGVLLTVVGQPQQTQYGITFRVLLDPRVQVKAPICQVRLQKQYIRQAPIGYPIQEGKGPPVHLPATDQYAVVGVRITGDTRGNEWYSEYTCLTQIKDALMLIAEGQNADIG